MSASAMAPNSGAVSERKQPATARCDLNAALLRDLSELSALLTRIDDDDYRRRPVGVFESSIGGHVRHCLDHFEALLKGIESGYMSFDDRRRGTAVETDRSSALSLMSELERRINTLSPFDANQVLELKALPAAGGSSINVKSSIGREVIFVLSHTTHHNAIIAAMAKILGVATSERFGVAASTIVYREQMKCAQ
mgnify:CR=1 FL=1